LSEIVEELRQRLVYAPKTGAFRWAEGHRFAGREAFTYKNKNGYLCTNIHFGGSKLLLTAHRAAWAIYYGAMPSGAIDHINGIRTDNRIANLRDVVNAENSRNMAMSKSNSSGVTGVYYHKQTGKWCAQIRAFGKTVGLGLFQSFSDAVIARKAAERVLGYHPNHGRKPAATQDALAHLLRGE
jgi:HNH endonuclease